MYLCIKMNFPGRLSEVRALQSTDKQTDATKRITTAEFADDNNIDDNL